MSNETQLTRMRLMKSELTGLEEKLEESLNELKVQFTQEVKKLEDDFQRRELDMKAPFLQKREAFRRELKEWLGTTDGEPISLLDVVELVNRGKMTLAYALFCVVCFFCGLSLGTRYELRKSSSQGENLGKRPMSSLLRGPSGFSVSSQAKFKPKANDDAAALLAEMRNAEER